MEAAGLECHGLHPRADHPGSGTRHTPDGLIEGVHERGHLIAGSLGGSNHGPGQLRAALPRANYPEMYWGFEAGALAAVRRGETLFYRAMAHYSVVIGPRAVRGPPRVQR